MKFIFLILILLTLPCATTVEKRGKWIIGSGSSISIHGSTNINSFACSVQHYRRVDTLDYLLRNDLRIFSDNKMIIPIQEFNCGNGLITKDLRRTVKAKEHPNLDIEFISLKGDLNGDRSLGKIEIRLAGVSKQINVEFLITKYHEMLQLHGTQCISFEDFGLTAPKHIVGLVKVEKDFDVEFNLVINPIDWPEGIE